jgi:hypothetical protein
MGLLTERFDMDTAGITYTATLNAGHAHGSAIDMKDALRIVFQVCHLANADDGSIIWTVEESATTTDGDFAELGASTYTATTTSAEVGTWKTIEVPASAMTATKRYIRLTATEAAAHNAAIAAVAVRELNYSNV